MLAITDLHAGYGGHPVLREVNLVVPDHAVVALLGPNAAGKTTLIRAASGLLKPTAGSVRLDDTDITRWPPDQRARAGICHVPEGRGIFRALTVMDNLRLQAAHPNDVEAAFDAFPRLAERRSQIAGTMSGGEQQMLALAHAYVTEPNVVLLDEVSMGLAPGIVDDIFGHLRALADRGTSLLLVEQYVSRALQLADYVYVLNKGRIVFAGEPAELSDAEIMASYLGEGAA